MRTTICYFLLAPLIITIAGSCKKEQLLTYNANSNIYFDYRQGVNPAANQAGTLVDSLAYSFAYSDASVKEAIVPIPVTVSGLPQNTDRSFELIVEAGASATQGKHYELPVLTMRAGRLRDTVFLKLKRTEELKDGGVSMKLHLQPNQYFDTLLVTRLALGVPVPVLSFKISVTDELTQGPSWSTFSTFFGAFSKKKMLLMHDITGLPLDFWAVATVTGEQRAAATYLSLIHI